MKAYSKHFLKRARKQKSSTLTPSSTQMIPFAHYCGYKLASWCFCFFISNEEIVQNSILWCYSNHDPFFLYFFLCLSLCLSVTLSVSLCQHLHHVLVKLLVFLSAHFLVSLQICIPNISRVLVWDHSLSCSFCHLFEWERMWIHKRQRALTHLLWTFTWCAGKFQYIKFDLNIFIRSLENIF